MTWARFDDRYPRHRKVDGLSDPAFRLDVSSVCWAAENLTDGVILTAELDQVSRLKGAKARKAAAELVEAGRWDVIPGGWQVHDYLDYNPTRDKVRREQAANRRRQEEHRARRNAVSNGVTSGVTNAAPSRPDPSGTAREGSQRHPRLSVVNGLNE